MIEGISSTELLRKLIDSTPVAYIILDQNFQIHYINQNFLKLRKLDYDSIIGEVCYNISNGGVKCRQCAVEGALQNGRKMMLSRKDTLPDGTVRYVDDYAFPLKTTNGGNKYILEMMVNRTKEMAARDRRDQSFNEILGVLSSLLEAKDVYTATHSRSVRTIAMRIASLMNLDDKDIFNISTAASLHDIGKVRIPGEIINKPGRLTDDEFEIIKHHPIVSYEMLRGLSSFVPIKDIILHHHERVDGRGYPDNLKGDDIPLGAKIVAVADTYDAITSTRSYREALSHEYALAEIERGIGTQFDEEVVRAFLSLDWASEAGELRPLDAKTKTVERVITAPMVRTGNSTVTDRDFEQDVDQDLLIQEIFENTPCGYVLMKPDRTVVFTSQYFLDYMGLTGDQVLGNVCYKAGGLGNHPCEPCAVAEALKTKDVAFQRMEQMAAGGMRIFDMFAVPLLGTGGHIDYMLEIVIDRTSEIMLERQREMDYRRLFDTLGDLLMSENPDEGGSRALSQELIRLRALLNKQLLNK